MFLANHTLTVNTNRNNRPIRTMPIFRDLDADTGDPSVMFRDVLRRQIGDIQAPQTDGRDENYAVILNACLNGQPRPEFQKNRITITLPPLAIAAEYKEHAW